MLLTENSVKDFLIRKRSDPRSTKPGPINYFKTANRSSKAYFKYKVENKLKILFKNKSII